VRLTPKLQCRSAGRGPSSRPAGLIALLILSVLCQSMVAAAHIHGTARRQLTCSAAGNCPLAVRSSVQPPYDPSEDHDGCLLCQAVSHGGAILPPSHPSIGHRANLSSMAALPTSQRPNLFILAYGSRQRGPPRL
jgi:hypothetical protein